MAKRVLKTDTYHIPAERLGKYLIQKTRTANFITLSDHIKETALIDYTIRGNSVAPDAAQCGIQHVGTLVTDKKSRQFGKYHIPLVCRGKNLFGGTGAVYEKYPLYIPAGTSFSVSKKCTGSNDGIFVFYDQDGMPLDFMPFSKAMQKNGRLLAICRQTARDIHYVGWRETAAAETQLEIGGCGAAYTPYRESRADIFLDKPLRAGESISFQNDGLPPILLPSDDVCTISVQTGIQPAGVTISYYQDTKAYINECLDDLLAIMSNSQ